MHKWLKLFILSYLNFLIYLSLLPQVTWDFLNKLLIFFTQGYLGFFCLRPFKLFDLFKPFYLRLPRFFYYRLFKHLTLSYLSFLSQDFKAT
jgi:hypothetical protein